MFIDWQIPDDVTGIIHAGAHTAEEAKEYGNIPTKWVEADPALYQALKERGLDVYHFAALDYCGEVALNLCPFKAANSILEPNLNKRRADVYVESTVEVPAMRLRQIQEAGYNLLVLDIQGAELLALKGADLSQIDYIVTEIHRAETYKGIPMVEEIDAYLGDHGFRRQITKWTKHGWGEALYTKK